MNLRGMHESLTKSMFSPSASFSGERPHSQFPSSLLERSRSSSEVETSEGEKRSTKCCSRLKALNTNSMQLVRFWKVCRYTTVACIYTYSRIKDTYIASAHVVCQLANDTLYGRVTYHVCSAIQTGQSMETMLKDNSSFPQEKIFIFLMA